MPVVRYSTALSGLLNAALIARCTSALSNPMSTSCKVKPPRLSRPFTLHCTQYWQVIAEVCLSQDCLYLPQDISCSCSSRLNDEVSQSIRSIGSRMLSRMFSDSIPITLHALLISRRRLVRCVLPNKG